MLAGRHAPAPAWSTDIEWAPLARVLALRNLPPDESQSYLTLRGVDAARHAQALAMTHGHPLALSLVADACARSPADAFDLGHEPDIVRTLLQKLFDEVPSAQHRLALDTCATIPAMTEPVLAAALGCDDAHAIFEWVAGLSFIEHGPRGLFPHDLAREVLLRRLALAQPRAAPHAERAAAGVLCTSGSSAPRASSSSASGST